MTERLAARVDDDDLIDAVGEAAEVHGSKSEALRVALRETYVEEAEAEEDETKNELAALGLSPSAERGYEVLREAAGVGQMVEVEAAKSLVASETNIPSDSVRSMVLAPLKSAGLIGVQPHIRAAFVTVHPITAAVDDGGEDGA